ncbi:divalent-cation tolerance protein CutA [Roseibacillus persicicus]|uniref:divalent-cation tolerance protein CutA n=1 Tax=Roseibacillus persicicus TaxID=454148 RepID=UPI00280E9461|nr:divalent-cation tolerance protein CutA [Roseibacillus persicicus]MDQ8190996.1 divalent-cation tolerance protein CutA [Roseibacillus persicicus]
MTDALVVLTAFADEASARDVTRQLVERGLVACVNLLPGATSIYRWKGEVCEESEVLAFLKNTTENYPALEKALQELHPYEEPEIIALDIAAGSEGYLAFLRGTAAE